MGTLLIRYVSHHTFRVDPKTRRLSEFSYAFRELREARTARSPRSAATEGPTEDDRAVVEAASEHTLESIVKGLAEVQLRFDRSVEELIETLGEEVTTLRTTRRAIGVETRRIEKLRSLKIAARALDLLRREHNEALQALEEEHRAQRETERRLQEQEDEKEADWAEREAALEARQDRRARYEEQLSSFEQAKADAVEAARNEARAQAKEDAEAEAALYEEEVAAKRSSYETKIALLEADVERQSEQITQRSNQLQSALQQTQRLAARAMSPGGEPPEAE